MNNSQENHLPKADPSLQSFTTDVESDLDIHISKKPILSYIKGDITKPIKKNIVICQVVNDIGRMGSGVALAIMNKWPVVEKEYKTWYHHRTGHNIPKPFQLGETQFIDVEYKIIVANMIAQSGTISPTNPTPIKYDILDKCLNQVYTFCKYNEMELHGPLFGSGLAAGDWSIIEKLILKNMKVSTVIYKY